jgi:hypothetical protein
MSFHESKQVILLLESSPPSRVGWLNQVVNEAPCMSGVQDLE